MSEPVPLVVREIQLGGVGVVIRVVGRQLQDDPKLGSSIRRRATRGIDALGASDDGPRHCQELGLLLGRLLGRRLGDGGVNGGGHGQSLLRDRIWGTTHLLHK